MIDIRRILLGLIALGMVALGMGLRLAASVEFYAETLAFLALRVGILLGVLWLALPQLVSVAKRVSPTTIVCLGLACLLMVVRPQLLKYIVPLLLGLMAFQYLTTVLGRPRR